VIKNKGIVLILALAFAACNLPVDTTETIPTNKLDAVEALAEEPKQESIPTKLLLTASFTEPYMSAEFYTDKAIFTFPEKDTLVWNQNFDSLGFTKDFKLNGKQDGKAIDVIIENKSCTHPGSGEKWEKKAFVEIDMVKYQGCAKTH
jgi:uncharacterized membrane protein